MRDDAYHCPVEVAMEIIGRRWSAVLLAHLKEAPRRYSELQSLVPDISDKMLTQRLRELSRDHLIARQSNPDTLNVEYDLTDEGRLLGPSLQALYDWGNHWADLHDLTIQPTDSP